MEHILEQKFSFYRDSNKETIREEFESLPKLLDFLRNLDNDSETLAAVTNWLGMQEASYEP